MYRAFAVDVAALPTAWFPRVAASSRLGLDSGYPSEWCTPVLILQLFSRLYLRPCLGRPAAATAVSCSNHPCASACGADIPGIAEASYYSFSPHPEWRLVMLDAFDVSMLGWPAGHPNHEAAHAILDEHNPNEVPLPPFLPL